MLLCDEICSFLDGKGLEYARGTIGGNEVIHAGCGAVILPVSIYAESIIDAGTQAESLYRTTQILLEERGEYPYLVTEDRWHLRQSMMQSRLLAHLYIFTQIYARNCEVRKIDKRAAEEFLSMYHSYGDASCRYRYGLFLKRHTGHNAGSASILPGTLVAVATFSNARKWIKGDKTILSYEWTRYASLPGVRLSGGMGKLLNAFIEDVKPDDIMTYADLEWSEGKVYEQLGFALEGFKEPVTFCVDTMSWRRSPIKSGMTGREPERRSPIKSGMTGREPGMTGRESGRRSPVKPGMTGREPGMIGREPGMTEREPGMTGREPERTGDVIPGLTGNLFFRNLGSNKYRMKLTDYQ